MTGTTDGSNAFEGPTFKTIIEDGEWRVFLCWGVTWFAGILTLLLWLNYWKSMKLLNDRHDPLRVWYMQIVFLGQIWALTTGLSVAFVRGFFLFSILQKGYEALALCCLRDAVLELAGRKEQLVAMLEGKKEKYYAAFPFMFVGWFMKEEEYSPKHITWSWHFTRQCYICIPGIASVQLFAVMMSTTVPHTFLTVLSFLQIVSVIIGVYGVLLVLAPARSLECMAAFHLGRKFLIIKGMVVLGLLQSFLIMFLVDLGALNKDPLLTQNTYVAEVLWASMLLAIESPVFIYYSAKFYPLAEVVDFYEEVDATLNNIMDFHRQASGLGLSRASSAGKLERDVSSFARDRLSLNAGAGLSLGLGLGLNSNEWSRSQQQRQQHQQSVGQFTPMLSVIGDSGAGDGGGDGGDAGNNSGSVVPTASFSEESVANDGSSPPV